jgi:hypothetical protein
LKKFTIIIILNLAGFISIIAVTNPFLHSSGTKIINGSGNEEVLNAVNFGNWMVMEGYMMNTSDFASTQHEIKQRIVSLIGDSLTNVFYKAWLWDYISQTDIDSLKKWGYNSIRIPIHYEYFATLGSPTQWDSLGFTILDSLVKWCKKDSIYAIIDLHAAPGGQGQNASISDYDSTKYSLWQSPTDKSLTIALWTKIATRYSHEKFVGGYDLINEPNWSLPNNTDLRNLYGSITTAIRQVDTSHIIFIEGNWFATDFTGLTPAWDKNMVYSFHKYWSHNNQATIQWMLDIRNKNNTPIWCGETGENSNYHFTKEMELFNKFDIGTSFWPYKKFESINSLVSSKWPEGYSQLLNYWQKGSNMPTKIEAFNTLMQLAENRKIQNCKTNRDVLYALFQQPGNRNTQPFAPNIIPGAIAATDFDLGTYLNTYKNTPIENLQSDSAYSAWNLGWAYRNDAVSIEVCADTANNNICNGYDVGWTSSGEWMKYTFNSLTTGIFDIELRTAGQSNGSVTLLIDNKNVANNINIPLTGGWQTWNSTYINDISITAGIHTLQFIINQPGFNITYFNFQLSSTLINVKNKAFKLFPNPTKNKLFIVFNNSNVQSIYNLTDLSGKQIQSGNLTNKNSINLGQIPSGFYLLNITYGSKQYTQLIQKN